MMERYSAVLGVITMLLFFATGGDVIAQDDIELHRSCAQCGMDRKAYGFSRMLVRYEDGTAVGVCSLRCAVVELDANRGRTTQDLFVADRDTRTLIDARTAVWVMGGAKRGVMTQRPKWAFATKAAAEAFMRTYGGAIVTWNEAIAAAREDIAQERR